MILFVLPAHMYISQQIDLKLIIYGKYIDSITGSPFSLRCIFDIVSMAVSCSLIVNFFPSPILRN